MPKPYVVPSVDRALRIIELLAESRRGLTLSDICRKLGLPKSSVHLLVKTLESAGYLKDNQINGRYHFGLKLVSLSRLALENLDLREHARPYLQDLMMKTSITVHMAVLERGEAVIIEKIEAPGLLRVATWVGRRLDASSSAVGKALLAYTPGVDLQQVHEASAMARYNRNTITTPKKLARELDRVREQGYAVEDEEGEIGMRCIGAPVYDADSRVICAISIAGSTSQIPKQRINELASLVKKTARELSLHTGHSWSDSSTAAAPLL